MEEKAKARLSDSQEWLLDRIKECPTGIQVEELIDRAMKMEFYAARKNVSRAIVRLKNKRLIFANEETGLIKCAFNLQ